MIPRRAENAHGMSVNLSFVHRPGALYEGNPLCLEAQAIAMGFDTDYVREMRFGGWPTINADHWDCPECAAQAYA